MKSVAPFGKPKAQPQRRPVLVIDVGGPLSHGAIVAQELGVPCVINTRVGTSVLHTGDVVRIDGAAGTVARL